MANGDVVIKQQDKIEIYQNEEGGITIKQYDSYGEDSCIWFHVEHAEMICLAIENSAKKLLEANHG